MVMNGHVYHLQNTRKRKYKGLICFFSAIKSMFYQMKGINHFIEAPPTIRISLTISMTEKNENPRKRPRVAPRSETKLMKG